MISGRIEVNSYASIRLILLAKFEDYPLHLYKNIYSADDFTVDIAQWRLHEIKECIQNLKELSVFLQPQ